jgi:hypothetical protein
MHCSASEPRAQLFRDVVAPALAREGVQYTIFDDVQKNGPWWNAERAWRSLMASREPYTMVLQDDMLPCAGFTDKLEAFVQQFFGRGLCVFQPAHREPEKVRELMNLGCNFVLPEDMIAWGGSILIPTEQLRSVIDLAGCFGGFGIHDDLRITRAMDRRGLRIVVRKKSLLRHVGASESVTGNSHPNTEYQTGFTFEGSP